MATLKLNSQTVVSESGGTLTAPALNITTGTFNGTVGASATLPIGVSQGVNYLMNLQTSGTSVGGTIGGTGSQVVPFNTIKAGTADGAFTQDILSLSSNKWTMNTGYYLYDFASPIYHASHVWVLGVATYGDNTGSGTSVSNPTTDNISFGSMFHYTNTTNADGNIHHHQGILKVTHTAQKYAFYINIENDTQHSTSTYTHSSTHNLVQRYLRFIRIGDV